MILVYSVVLGYTGNEPKKANRSETPGRKATGLQREIAMVAGLPDCVSLDTLFGVTTF